MKSLKPTILAIALSGLTFSPAFAQDKAALAAEGKALMMQFGTELKATLGAAMKAGGPVNAIGVCNTEAPVIATNMAAGSDWFVGRSSHKLRNPANEADPFTAMAIDEFLTRQSAGESAADLVKTAIVEENGHQVFRLVKAIPTQEVCLNCHGGDNVKPEVEARLSELYPEDQARGFSVGEMRGVFTLSKVLNN